MALLGKWHWRLLKGEEDMWVRVVKARYGALDYSGMGSVGALSRRNASSWWKNIGGCGVAAGSLDWFRLGLDRRLGKGDKTLFWVGIRSLKDEFPRLYQISLQQNRVITDCGFWCDRKWEWEILWRRNLFVWEQQLYLILHSASLIEEEDDEWKWGLDCSGLYTTKSAYSYLEKQVVELQHLVYKLLWKGKTPSKILAFSWQLFKGRLPTKMNLLRRGMGL